MPNDTITMPTTQPQPMLVGTAHGAPGVPSESDARTVNNSNVMRHDYRVLTDSEKNAMVELKDAGLAFINLLHKIGNSDAVQRQQDRQSSRELSLSQTKIEEAVMWAVKHLTK